MQNISHLQILVILVSEIA